MTRRKSRQEAELAKRFREQRIAKLLDRGLIRSASEIPPHAIPVDPDLVNFGGWDPPLFYQDRWFSCRDCGVSTAWSAEDQRWYYETTKAPYFKIAVRCRECRRKEGERIREARRQAGHEADGK